MMLPAVRTVRMRDQTWRIAKLEKGKARGICEAPHVPGKAMDIPLHGGTIKDLDTILHESLHAALWDLDEEAVYDTAKDMARILWRLGWRKAVEVRT